MTKLIKTDREIVPATSLASKVTDALAGESKLAQPVGAHSKCDCQHLREDHDWFDGATCMINGCACPRFQMRVDAVGPGIPITVEALNPVLREWAGRSREIVIDTETRRVDVGVPPGELTATFESAKIITGKDGRPQLAVEMKVEGTGQKLTSMMPVGSAIKAGMGEFVGALINKPAICNSPSKGWWDADTGQPLRCTLPEGHQSEHRNERPGQSTFAWDNPQWSENIE